MGSRQRGPAQLPRYLQVALAFRRLTGAEGASATGEQQARRLASTEEIEAGEKAIGVMPLTQPRQAGGGMAAAGEHDDGISLGDLQGGGALPEGLQPTPEALAHQHQGKDQEQ